MASKLALVAFLVLFGLAQLGARWLAPTGGSAVTAPASDAVAAVESPNADAVASRPQAPRHDHILWNAACWLVGLGLAVSLGRRGVPQPALD